MPKCAIYGCSNRPGSKNDPEQSKIRFFNMPTVLTHQGEETRHLSIERRRLWKAAINRKDILTEDTWDRTVVCARHFVNGVKAYFHLRNSPSWLPTLHLGYGTISPSSLSKARYSRLSARKNKQAVSKLTSVTTRSRKILKVNKSGENADECANTGNIVKILQIGDEDVNKFNETPDNNITVAQSKFYLDLDTGVSVQTDITMEQLKHMYDYFYSSIAESCHKKTFVSIYERQYYVENENQVPFYTGLPTLALSDLVFNDYVSPYMTDSTTLSKEQEFFLCLIKLKMGYQFQDIANQLKVSLSTVHMSFHRTLDLLVTRLSFLIKWPGREQLRLTMPMCFSELFADTVAVIVDCLEVVADTSSGAAKQINRPINSQHKHNQTVKFLLGITPQVAVSFISEAWDGQNSLNKVVLLNICCQKIFC